MISEKRSRYDIQAVLAANGAKLEAKRDAVRREMQAERDEQERREAELQRQRDEEWAAQCRAEKQPADVLPWRKGAV